MRISPYTIKKSLDRVAGKVPVSVWQRLFPRDAYVPFYHIVSDDRLPHARLYPYKNARQFENDLACARERFAFIDYSELIACRLRQERVKRNRFLFTFDDGFAECFDVVRPLLRKYEAPCVFFVTRDFIDDRTSFFENKLSLCVTAALELSGEDTRSAIAALHLDGQDGHASAKGQRRMAARLRRARIESSADAELARLCAWLLGLGHADVEQIDHACDILHVDMNEYKRQQEIVRCHDFIELLFDTGGLGTSPAHVVDRFWADFFEDDDCVVTDRSLDFNLRWHFAHRNA